MGVGVECFEHHCMHRQYLSLVLLDVTILLLFLMWPTALHAHNFLQGIVLDKSYYYFISSMPMLRQGPELLHIKYSLKPLIL